MTKKFDVKESKDLQVMDLSETSKAALRAATSAKISSELVPLRRGFFVRLRDAWRKIRGR